MIYSASFSGTKLNSIPKALHIIRELLVVIKFIEDGCLKHLFGTQCHIA
uniref:Uncharacterized protein n=1 Tax=Arundo donax TaxID=35708 RepID=A0A0A9AXA7_ARUDO